ncbi:ScbR family autoregulator-binding transcription factor [Streptomyces albidoflavus]|uniref:ScbR family autoregulator-binding transcription factor n=1 Tax=Streptomyces albidoflavus TaxID=1886 RepID=UPI00331B76B2
MARQERALRTREALIRAGAEHFARDGFVAASLSTISRSAGVSNGALHFHFENKRALAQAVGEHARRTLRLVVEEAWAGGTHALPVLVEATFGLVRRLADDVVLRAGFELGAPAEGGGSSLRQEWRWRVDEMVGLAEAEGWIAPGARAEDVVTAVVAATVGFESMGREDRAWLSGDTVRGFWDLLLPRLTDQPAGLFFPTRKRPQSRYEMPPFDRMSGRTEGPSGA